MNEITTVTIEVPCGIDILVGRDCDGNKEIVDIGFTSITLGESIIPIGHATLRKLYSDKVTSIQNRLLDWYLMELENELAELDAHEHEEHLKSKADDLLHERAAA